MQQSRRSRETSISVDIDARIFYCPHPGCNRSFAELWRLKVHFRAPPDVRGSGKERGHGTELKFCPKCGKELKAGKHHVGCSAGKSAPRQAAKRQRQMSTTSDTGDWATHTSSHSDQVTDESDSWENVVRRQVNRVRRQQSLDMESSLRQNPRSAEDYSAVGMHHQSTSADPACRLVQLKESLTAGDPHAELVFTADTMADFGLILRGGSHTNRDDIPSGDVPPQSTINRGISPPPPFIDLHTHGDIVEGTDDVLPHLRVPSPPPLPSDWDLAPAPASLLFDFDQFDASRRGTFGGIGEPIMTATAAINPSEISNPSDDYIWQILFAGENDPVPKRVTAHLHHNPHEDDDLRAMHQHHQQHRNNTAHRGGTINTKTLFDEPDPILDSIPWPIDQDPAILSGKEIGKDSGKGGKGSMQPPPPRPLGNLPGSPVIQQHANENNGNAVADGNGGVLLTTAMPVPDSALDNNNDNTNTDREGKAKTENVDLAVGQDSLPEIPNCTLNKDMADALVGHDSLDHGKGTGGSVGCEESPQNGDKA